MDGVVNVHKTAGPTSHDVVDQVRRIFGQRRVGHAGTLDPMATGVLVVCLGKATRIVEYLVGTQKEYRAIMTLGVTTDSEDSTGEVLTEADAAGITVEMLGQVVQSFIGEIEQVPPMVSAIKHEGKRLYKLAREGKTVERAPRRVTVYSIEVGQMTSVPTDTIPGGGTRLEVELTVLCSSGTYIRTLCADIGDKLGCGGMMSKLERTRVGRFAIDQAVTVDQLREAQEQSRLEYLISPIFQSLDDMPAVQVDDDDARRVLHGIPVAALDGQEIDTVVRLLSPTGELLAIGAVTDLDGVLSIRPRKVLVDSQ